MIKFADAHCHFQTPLANSAIAFCATNAVQESDWNNMLELQSDKMFVCLGIHPWYIDSADKSWDRKLYQILESNPDIMVGETGLDNLRPNINEQEIFFVRHMEIAHNTQRIMHIHCVKAWDKLLNLLKTNRNILPPKILIHGFSGSPEIINKLINSYDIYFSYSASQTVTSNQRNIHRILATPDERMLIESDETLQSNAEKKLMLACSNIAEIKNTPQQNIANITLTNFQRIFKNHD